MQRRLTAAIWRTTTSQCLLLLALWTKQLCKAKKLLRSELFSYPLRRCSRMKTFLSRVKRWERANKVGINSNVSGKSSPLGCSLTLLGALLLSPVLVALSLFVINSELKYYVMVNSCSSVFFHLLLTSYVMVFICAAFSDTLHGPPWSPTIWSES